MKYSITRSLLCGYAFALGLFVGTAYATPLFSDDFNDGVLSGWNNESGNWREVGGTYDATNPNNSPNTYSSVIGLTNLTDFAVDVRVNNWNDGGLWLRSDYNGGNISGVLLVTGGFSGTFNGLYWHAVQNGAFSAPLSQVGVPGLQGTDVDLHVEVVGDTYRAFINGDVTPVSTLTTGVSAMGSVGLYDYSPTNGAVAPRGQTFDDFQVTDLTIQAPEPGALSLFGLGLLGLGLVRRRTTG